MCYSRFEQITQFSYGKYPKGYIAQTPEKGSRGVLKNPVPLASSRLHCALRLKKGPMMDDNRVVFRVKLLFQHPPRYIYFKIGNLVVRGLGQLNDPWGRFWGFG